VDWFVKRFLQAALVWLGLGVTLGAAMAVYPLLVVYRPAHIHTNLLGFVAMMIFGVAYHVIPRFFGQKLRYRWLAGAHWWIANCGLTLMFIGFLLAPNVGTLSKPALAVGGILSTVGAFFFIVNMWRTMDGPALVPRADGAPASRRLPLEGSETNR